jgi:hypothetical protein
LEEEDEEEEDSSFFKTKKKKQNRSLLLTYSLKLRPKIETKPQVGESKRFSTTRFGD